jgi:sugar O-acyltransferase (sialic acid O-acetyltransferase NeuD family)
MERIVVIGGGGHAKVLISVLKGTPWDVVGYTDPQDRGPLLGVPHLGDDPILAELLSTRGIQHAIIGLGKIDVSSTRMRLQGQIESLGYAFPVVVSPQAVVNESVQLGSGTVALDGVVITSGTVAGRCCILNTNSTIEHDCRLGDNVHVASGATVSGGVTVGDDSLIGAGATIVQSVTIGHGCLIGAGAVVVTDITEPGTYVGVPARRTR